MNLKTTSTNKNMIFQVYNYSDEPQKAYMIISDKISPDIAYSLKIHTDYDIEVLYVKSDTKCPVCGHELIKNGTEPLSLNKNLKIKKQKYLCKNRKCKESSSIVSLEKYKKKYYNYTDYFTNLSLNTNTISYDSLSHKSEKINLMCGVKKPITTILTHEKQNKDEYINKNNSKLNKLFKIKNIEPSGYYNYDEEYTFIERNLYLRMTFLDNKTRQIIGKELVNFKDFNPTLLKKFFNDNLQYIKKDTIITDGYKPYQEIIKEMNLKHQLCAFHNLSNFMKKGHRKASKLKRRLKTLNNKIKYETNKIKEIKTKYKAKKSRPRKNDYKMQERQRKIKKHEQKKTKYKQEKNQITKELDEIERKNHAIKMIFKSKTLKGFNNRFNRLNDNINNLPLDVHSFIRNLKSK